MAFGAEHVSRWWCVLIPGVPSFVGSLFLESLISRSLMSGGHYFWGPSFVGSLFLESLISRSLMPGGHYFWGPSFVGSLFLGS